MTGIQTNMISTTNISAFRVVHKAVNALPWDYQQAGYSTLFMHPGYSWFYNRDSVYQFLGMGGAHLQRELHASGSEGDDDL